MYKRTTKQKKVAIAVTLIISFLIALSSLVFALRQASLPQAFFTDAERCNTQNQALRYSCYRATIQKYFTGNLSSYVSAIHSAKNLSFKARDNSYAIFGTNCHTFYHALGDFIASNVPADDIQNAVNLCPLGCTQGCVMGVSKRLSLRNHYKTDFFKTFYAACKTEEKHHCAHEIGHNLSDKYTESVLATIDDLTEKTYGFSTNETYQYKTYDKPDLNAAFSQCREILPPEEVSYCYTGIGHNLYLFSEFSPEGYASQINECKTTDPSNSEDCLSFLMLRIGINEAAPQFLGNHFEQGIAVCNQVTEEMNRQDLKQRCYLGLGGGIGFFVEERYVDTVFEQKSLTTIKNELLELGQLCKHVPNEFLEKCYTGLLNTKYRTLYEDLYLSDADIDYQLEYNTHLARSDDKSLFPD